MKLLRRLFQMDRPIADSDPNPDDVVWVATVALWQAPLIVHELAQVEIAATFAESSSRRAIVGGFPAARIYVRQADRIRAERLITDVTS